MISFLIVCTFSLYQQLSVIITVKYPQKKAVGNLFVRGDGCLLSWNKGILLSKISVDTWQTTLQCQPALTNIKILLNDCMWMFGPNFKFTPNDTQHQFTVFPSFTPKSNPIRYVQSVYSQILKNSRNLSIYYPPSFYDNDYKKYPLLIMQDGQNLFYDNTSAFGSWHIHSTIDQLTAEGLINQIIVVGIWNTQDRINEYTYSYDPQQKLGGKGDLYLRFMTQELLPRLKQMFKDRLDQTLPAVGGSSLGGLISCYSLYNSRQFGKAICMSSSFWWNSQDFSNKIISSKRAGVFYIDSGDSGPSQDSKNQTLRVYNKLVNLGYQDSKQVFYYLDKGGQHNQQYWGKRFKVPLIDLFGN